MHSKYMHFFWLKICCKRYAMFYFTPSSLRKQITMKHYMCGCGCGLDVNSVAILFHTQPHCMVPWENIYNNQTNLYEHVVSTKYHFFMIYGRIKSSRNYVAENIAWGLFSYSKKIKIWDKFKQNSTKCQSVINQ